MPRDHIRCDFSDLVEALVVESESSNVRLATWCPSEEILLRPSLRLCSALLSDCSGNTEEEAGEAGLRSRLFVLSYGVGIERVRGTSRPSDPDAFQGHSH